MPTKLTKSKLITLSLQFLFYCPAAQATEKLSNVFQYNAQSHCIAVDDFSHHSQVKPIITESQERELSPWLRKWEAQLRFYIYDLTEELNKTKTKFLLELNKRDNSADMLLLQSSNSKVLDEKLTAGIKATLPFLPPPNSAPFYRKLIIEFDAAGAKVKLAPKGYVAPTTITQKHASRNR